MKDKTIKDQKDEIVKIREELGKPAFSLTLDIAEDKLKKSSIEISKLHKELSEIRKLKLEYNKMVQQVSKIGEII